MTITIPDSPRLAARIQAGGFEGPADYVAHLVESDLEAHPVEGDADYIEWRKNFDKLLSAALPDGPCPMVDRASLYPDHDR